MKPDEEKARRDWVHSMHLRPVYILGNEWQRDGDDELVVYIAIGYLPGHRQKTELRLIPVNGKYPTIAVSYKNRGILFPWDDTDLASSILFKTEVAKKREQLLREYGELDDNK